MSTPAGGREEVLAALRAEMIQTVAAGLLFHEAVAQRAGLSLSELKCLTLVAEGDEITAGEVAARTGLTTGAVTRMVDRLEQRGWVVRASDPADRRRVLVRARPERLDELVPLYAGMSEAWGRALLEYDDDQVRLLLELFKRMRAVAEEQAQLLSGGTPPSAASRSSSPSPRPAPPPTPG